MAFRVVAIALIICHLIKCQMAAHSGKGQGQNQDFPPFCSNASVPFENEAAVLNYTKHFERECIYNYWKVGNDYHGMNGYKQMFGEFGYIYNESTIWEHDGTPTRGYVKARVKAVVSHNLIYLQSPPYDIRILEWSEYEVFHKATVQTVLNVGPFRNANKSMEYFTRVTWFNDSSGIVKYYRMNSTSSIFGVVVSAAITTTQVISGQLGYLNDDDADYSTDYVKNPIQFIFISVFCGLSVFIGVCVYMLLKYILPAKNRLLENVNKFK